MDEYKVPAEHLKVLKAIMPASFEDTKFVEVYTEEQFNLMVSDLRTVRELAIDLEVSVSCNMLICNIVIAFIYLNTGAQLSHVSRVYVFNASVH